MRPATQTDRIRRRTIARRIAYHYPERDLPYITQQGSRKQAQLQTDLDYLNDLFGLNAPHRVHR